MITLSADARQLTKKAKYSYLTQNYTSGQSAVVVSNSNFAIANDYVLFSEFGQQTSEIVKISSVTSATHTLNLATNTLFAHSQDTKVTVIKYNQVKFYQTAAATFDSNENYLGVVDVQANRTHTIYQDTTNTTGFGWFVFYNETTAKATTNSNAIPYAGFGENSVKDIFDSFFSLLNNKEMKLIDHADAFKWLNEGYAKMQNALNLSNPSYKVASEWTVTTVASTKEYALATDFSNLVSVTNADGKDIRFISLADVPKNDDDESYTDESVKYFLRGSYIGFSPVPTSADTYYVYYKKKTAALTSYYDNVDLPDNNFYPIVDFMLYRASPKIGRNAKEYKDDFDNSIKEMKIISNKQNENNDSWTIDQYANV